MSGPATTPATTGTQAEFAAAQGWAKSYVTKLKHEGRLVFSADGRVDFAASLDRIRATTGAMERAAPAVQGPVINEAKERGSWYGAEMQRLEYERTVKLSLDRAEVDATIDDAAAIIRTSVEAWRDSLPPQLAACGADEVRIAALLADECETLLLRMADRFGKLAQEAADE